MTKPTQGPWEVHGCTITTKEEYKDGNPIGGEEIAITYDPFVPEIPSEEMVANAHFIAAAGTAASECESLGYDGTACVRALPDLLSLVTYVANNCGGFEHNQAVNALAACKPQTK